MFANHILQEFYTLLRDQIQILKNYFYFREIVKRMVESYTAIWRTAAGMVLWVWYGIVGTVWYCIVVFCGAVPYCLVLFDGQCCGSANMSFGSADQ
jgi:hypothetical protein